MQPKTKIGYGIAAGAVMAGSLIMNSEPLQDFLGRWEGEAQYVVYADTLSNNLPTVCKGITRHSSPYPVVIGEAWSKEKCEYAEEYAVSNMQKILVSCLKAPVTQNMFDAFSSHGHNFGIGRTCGMRAVTLINQQNYIEGCNAIAFGEDGRKVWTTSDGKYYQGLHNRRLAERKLCLTGVEDNSYAASTQLDSTSPKPMLPPVAPIDSTPKLPQEEAIVPQETLIEHVGEPVVPQETQAEKEKRGFFAALFALFRG